MPNKQIDQLASIKNEAGMLGKSPRPFKEGEKKQTTENKVCT